MTELNDDKDKNLLRPTDPAIFLQAMVGVIGAEKTKEIFIFYEELFEDIKEVRKIMEKEKQNDRST